MFRGITRPEWSVLIATLAIGVASIAWFSWSATSARTTTRTVKPGTPVVIIPNNTIPEQTPEPVSEHGPEQGSEPDVQTEAPVLEELSELAPEAVLETGNFINGQLDLNAATVADLDMLPGIGPVKAQAIIDHRNATGPFFTVDQITDVAGIGEKTLEKLRPMIVVPNAPGIIPDHSWNSPGAGPENPPITSNEVRIHVNRATFEELQELKGIGPSLAEKIMIDRHYNGPYKNLREMERVKGIGPKTVEGFQDNVRFD